MTYGQSKSCREPEVSLIGFLSLDFLVVLYNLLREESIHSFNYMCFTEFTSLLGSNDLDQSLY